MMRRTRGRPVPHGRVTSRAAMVFGLVTALFSVAALWGLTNAVAAGLLAFTIFFYVVIYTIWLKRSAPQNIVIGGASGALPPMIGWAAATGEIGLPGISMFLLIFMWTPPHFWSLSLFMKDDYERAGVPMLTVTHGSESARHHILGYTVLLALTAVLPILVGIGGIIYVATALIMNARFLFGAWQLARRDNGEAVKDHFAAERAFFRFSLWYLFLHFSALVGDAGLAVWLP
ncbi:protoheme IX farnesyltransferase [Profundibacter amoris]|uniref:Heme o synthase n=2 Tax=Profundibacter amoris TaxID=2171755 RepID=A0A347UD26_9RHOB|nr:protoheme IX farnesyltransferase [Profundibacter amoris]